MKSGLHVLTRPELEHELEIGFEDLSTNSFGIREDKLRRR